MSAHQVARPLAAAHEVLQPDQQSADQARALVAAKCWGLLAGYHARWADAPYLIDDVEVVVQGKLYNPGTGRESRTFRIGGKIDIRARDRQTGSRVLIDHKTTSQDVADLNGTYWQQLAVEGQASHYMLLEWQQGEPVEYAVWDAVRKPGITPKVLSKVERLGALATESYYDHVLTARDLDLLEAPDARETPSLYALRLAHDCTSVRPNWYFQRRQVVRLDTDMAEYARELWQHGQDLLQARRAPVTPRNGGACMLYGSPCKFLGICSGYDTAHSDRWANKIYVHNELPMEAEGDGRDLLTTSRVRCFQTCRRKHYYEYEVGIERVDQEEREALFFGTLLHQALEQYFLALQREQQKGLQ